MFILKVKLVSGLLMAFVSEKEQFLEFDNKEDMNATYTEIRKRYGDSVEMSYFETSESKSFPKELDEAINEDIRKKEFIDSTFRSIGVDEVIFDREVSLDEIYEEAKKIATSQELRNQLKKTDTFLFSK